MEKNLGGGVPCLRGSQFNIQGDYSCASIDVKYFYFRQFDDEVRYW